MFKKIITFLTLASFLMSSQMHLVHAFEMQEMTDDHTGIHTMGMMEHSMFCETKKETPDKNSPECLKAISQDILIPMKQWLGNDTKNQIVKLSVFQGNIVYCWKSDAFSNCPPTAPPKRQDKQSYVALVGIIKRID